MANAIICSGRLVADPELRTVGKDRSVCNFRIAVPRRFKPQDGPESDFFDVVTWNRTAEFVCRYFTKGKWIEVVGALQNRAWTDREGSRRTATEIVADIVNFVGDPPHGQNRGKQKLQLAEPPVPQSDLPF